MIENVLQKRVVNGSVPSLFEQDKNKKVVEQTDKLFNIFYHGDKLTPLEHDVERMYISEKMQKNAKYQARNSFRYKVKWTISDLNRFQDQRKYRMNDHEYFGLTKPEFEPFDMDFAIKCMKTHQDIQGTSRLRKLLTYFTDQSNLERGQKRSVMQANILMSRMLMYIDSWEFVNTMDIPNDFHINHSIANMHLWLIYQRLRDFSENKFAF